MKLSQEFFARIRQEVSIVSIIQNSVQLKRKGKDYLGLCPFHSENTPSFTVNVDKRFYHCFGCAAHGDVIQFIASYESMPYKEAAIKIAKEQGIQIPQKGETESFAQIYQALEFASKFFQSNLNFAAEEYLEQRCVKKSLRDTFEIGYAPGQNKLTNKLMEQGISTATLEQAGLVTKNATGSTYEVFRNRIIFPIKNSYGQVVGFGGRTMDNAHPKYLNSPETAVFKKSSILFAEHLSIKTGYKTNSLILVEGYLDAIAMHSLGITNTVASLGTAVTSQHLTKIWQHVDEIVLCLDQDQAGLNAVQKIIQIALEHLSTKKHVSIMSLPSGMDPDSAINQNKVNIHEILQKKMPLSEAIWHYSSIDQNFEGAEKKAKLEQLLMHYASQIQDPILRKNYYQFFKDKLRSKQNRFYSDRNTLHNKEKTELPKFFHKTELENVEYCIIASIVFTPVLTFDSDILEELSRLAFVAKGTGDFIDWLIETYTQDSLNSESLISSIESSRFSDLYLSKIKNYQNYAEKNINPKQSIMMLCNRHKLETLKEEYLKIMQSTNLEHKDHNTALKAYQKEITSLTDKINASME